MIKSFASQGDTVSKKVSFTEMGEDIYAFIAESDPNSGVIISDNAVMIIEAQATPELAKKVIEKVRNVADKPITQLVLTHYHAVRVLSALAYNAPQIIIQIPPTVWSSNKVKKIGGVNSNDFHVCLRAITKFLD